MDERLEFIEGVFSKSIENHESPLDNLEIADVDYLIDEAKKVQELERDRKYWYETYQEQKELSRGQIKKLQEQVQELERDRAEWEIESHTQNARNKRLEHHNQRYKEALEFYAEEKKYDRPYDNEDYFDCLPSEMDFDKGEKARQALRGES